MTNQSTQQNKKLHTAITAGFLGLVVLVGVSVLYGGSYDGSTQQAEAGEIVDQNENAEFTINTNTINPSSVNVSRVTGGSTVYENENFQIEWSTSNANYQSGQVTGSGSGWSNGTLPANGTHNDSKSSPGSYTYTVSASNVEGGATISDSVTVDVQDRPERYDLSLTYPGVDIDGVPGSTARQGIDINGENGFSGNVDLSVVNIPSSLKDSSGNNKVSFTFDNSTISGGDGATDLNMEVIQAIDESVSPMITVRANDTSGTAQDQVQDETFRLNVDAFSPRTIEEF